MGCEDLLGMPGGKPRRDGFKFPFSTELTLHPKGSVRYRDPVRSFDAQPLKGCWGLPGFQTTVRTVEEWRGLRGPGGACGGLQGVASQSVVSQSIQTINPHTYDAKSHPKVSLSACYGLKSKAWCLHESGERHGPEARHWNVKNCHWEEPYYVCLAESSTSQHGGQ